MGGTGVNIAVRYTADHVFSHHWVQKLLTYGTTALYGISVSYWCKKIVIQGSHVSKPEASPSPWTISVPIADRYRSPHSVARRLVNTPVFRLLAMLNANNKVKPTQFALERLQIQHLLVISTAQMPNSSFEAGQNASENMKLDRSTSQ